MRALRTVVDRVVRGPFAPSEASVAIAAYLVGVLAGGLAAALLERRYGFGVAAVAMTVASAVLVGVFVWRDRRVRVDRRDGRRR